MKPGDYRILVSVLEAKDIKAKGKAGGGGLLSNFEGETADPMVEVTNIYLLASRIANLAYSLFRWR